MQAHYRPTTHTFRMNGYAMKEMSVPSYQVNSATADAGGVENNLGAASSKGKSSKGNSSKGESINTTTPPPLSPPKV